MENEQVSSRLFKIAPLIHKVLLSSIQRVHNDINDVSPSSAVPWTGTLENEHFLVAPVQDRTTTLSVSLCDLEAARFALDSQKSSHRAARSVGFRGH